MMIPAKRATGIRIACVIGALTVTGLQAGSSLTAGQAAASLRLEQNDKTVVIFEGRSGS